MKYIFFAVTFLSLQVYANEIQGTLVLKGKANGKAKYQNTLLECVVDINDVKNEMLEDQFHNPSYKVVADVKASGTIKVAGKEKRIKYEKSSIAFTNRAIQTNIVSDSLYRTIDPSDKIRFEINSDGRLLKAQMTITNLDNRAEEIECLF